MCLPLTNELLRYVCRAPPLQASSLISHFLYLIRESIYCGETLFYLTCTNIVTSSKFFFVIYTYCEVICFRTNRFFDAGDNVSEPFFFVHTALMSCTFSLLTIILDIRYFSAKNRKVIKVQMSSSKLKRGQLLTIHVFFASKPAYHLHEFTYSHYYV